MITIFHGDDTTKSREAFLEFIKNFSDSEYHNFDNKNLDFDSLNGLLNAGYLFDTSKLVSISNFFSISKALSNKVVPLINKTDTEIALWQDKLLSSAQLKIFPSSKVYVFKADNEIFSCINSVKPKNLNKFIEKFDLVLKSSQYDLFLYLLKGSIRRQLVSRSSFNINNLQKIYLQLIELEYQTKSGQLSMPPSLALKRVMVPLLR